MQYARKNLTPNMMQNYSTKSPIVLDSQVLQIQPRSEIQDDLKRIMNSQINNNLVQTSSGTGNGQKNAKKPYQQIKVTKQMSNNNSMNANNNNSSLGMQQQQNQQIVYQQQQQQGQYNTPANSNGIIQYLNEYVTNAKLNNVNSTNNQSNQENAIQSEIKSNSKAQINALVDLNDMKKSLSDIKLPKLSSQLKKKNGALVNEQPRSQSTQPIREQQVIIRNKNNESLNGNIIMHTEASALQNESVGSSQLLNRISQTYDIQQKMITDIENIDYQNGKGYSYQKQAQQQFQQSQDVLPNNSKRPTQSTIYKQVQQSKYNNKQTDNNNSAHQNILKQSFQISLPIKMQIEKQLQQQKQSSTINSSEMNKMGDKNGKQGENNEEKQNTIEIVGLNQQQKQLIQKNKYSNVVTQSVDSNFKNYLKNHNMKKNITPEPVRMSADSIYNQQNVNAARIQNEGDHMDAKTLQNHLNQFRVRSQTPNGNVKSNNSQVINAKKTHTPISSSNLQNDFNTAMNNMYNSAQQNNVNEYIMQNSSKQQKPQQQQQQVSANNQGAHQYTNNPAFANQQYQSQQVQNNQQAANQQHQQVSKINNYEYNLSYDQIPESQNFRHKTPIKLKINNNSIIKIHKVPFTEEKEFIENQNLKNSKLINSQQQSNLNQTKTDKFVQKQNDNTTVTTGDISSSKSRLQKNNFIGESTNENTINQENIAVMSSANGSYSAQRSSSANKNKFQLNLSKTPEQQTRKGQGQTVQGQFQNQQLNINKMNEQKQNKQLIKKYQHKTKAGCNYNGPKTNQDNFIIHPNVNNKADRYIFAVCDGHGVYGHLCSSFLRRILPKKIEEALAREINNTENDFIENSLNLAFLQSSKELLESNIDCTFSGSTCVLLLMIGKQIWSANAGDSRAIICSSQTEQSDWSFKCLSRDHKPDDPDEYRRIISRGGRVETYRDEYNNPLGPYRVWLRDENIPGLAMARSFGDVIASQVGVTCEPEILQFSVSDSDRFIILASDGVWEFISNNDVMNHVIPFFKLDDIDQGCQKLVKESTTQWKLNDEVVDDITCILIFLN